jgi:hypothetical protein
MPDTAIKGRHTAKQRRHLEIFVFFAHKRGGGIDIDTTHFARNLCRVMRIINSLSLRENNSEALSIKKTIRA